MSDKKKTEVQQKTEQYKEEAADTRQKIQNVKDKTGIRTKGE